MNHLGSEVSPYLLQHKDNPVNWYPWGEEAFEEAKRRGCPVFLSIGYSTCYWCHVMEKDSFEQQDVADILNAHFVAIKLDREERPDLDQIYMDAVMAIHGHGGWPLSVFLTPDKKPFWGATFFWREQFKQILLQIADSWRGKRIEIEESAESMVEAMQFAPEPSQGTVVEDGFDNLIAELEQSFDKRYKGFGKAPKFPQSAQVRALLRATHYQRGANTQEKALQTLEAMACGGIFDQIGGGFHRYSTDEKWLVPHFEKMLYDNALLAVAYLEAYQLTRRTFFADIAKKVLGWMEREMLLENGLFAAALDAGEVDAEGEYYVWTWAELSDLLSEIELTTAKNVFSLEQNGNFEGKNVLAFRSANQWSVRDTKEFRSLEKKLFNKRKDRTYPGRDEKALLSWNALAVTAFSFASRVLANRDYRDVATKVMAQLENSLLAGDEPRRSFCAGEAKHQVVLEDLVFLVEAYLELYCMSADTSYLKKAERYQKTLEESFWDQDLLLYRASVAGDVFRQKYEISDGATPSPNSVVVGNLSRLFSLIGEPWMKTRIDDLNRGLSPIIERAPGAVCRALSEFVDAKYRQQLVLTCADRKRLETLRHELDLLFAPQLLVGISSESGATYPPLLQGKSAEQAPQFFLCDESGCKPPVSSLEELLEELPSAVL